MTSVEEKIKEKLIKEEKTRTENARKSMLLKLIAEEAQKQRNK